MNENKKLLAWKKNATIAKHLSTKVEKKKRGSGLSIIIAYFF